MTADVQEVRAAAMRRDLARFNATLNLDELRILDRVQQRLIIGLERYGHLDLSKPRDWRKERFEERLDALVYDVAEELAAEDVAREPLRAAAGRELAEWEVSKTRISPASEEISRSEPALLAIEDLRNGVDYDFFDVSDVEPS